MDPTTPCCPHVACPARGQTGQGHMGIHSRQDRRVIGQPCRQTFTAPTGTVVSRLRTAAELVVLVVTWLAQGGPWQALVAAFRLDERTVAEWWARAGQPGQAVQESWVEPPRDRGPVPADEIRVKPQGGIVWMALALMSRTRVWLAGEVRAPRDRPLLRRLMERGRRCATHRPLGCCTDGLCASRRALRETCRDPERTGAHGRPRRRPWRHVGIAQVVKRDTQRRVGDVERRLVEGTPARVETLRRRSSGEGVIHTADSERLHATFRDRLASLTRRGRALARRPRTLPHGRSRMGTVDNFCPPHASRDRVGSATTPAMAAGITEHGWSVRARLSSHVPPPRWTPPTPRGRPSHALKRLMERWCGDHG